MGPRVEIAIPFYGTMPYLQEAVLSVQAQRDPDWRLRVYDDNVPADPATRRWLADLDDPRIEYETNPRNLGAAGNYNQCLARAEADWILIMGHDDRLLPDFVGAARADLAEVHGPVDVYQPRVALIDADGRRISPLADRVKVVLQPRTAAVAVLEGESLARGLMHGTWTYFPAMLWRTATIARYGFHADSDIVQDSRLLLDVILDGGRFALGPEVTFEYRRHEAASSATSLATGQRFAEERAFYADYRERLALRGWDTAARAARWHLTSRLHAVTVAAGCVRGREPRAAWRLVRDHALAR